LLNGVAASNVCGTAPSGYSGRFIHNEQDPGFRDPADWAPAVAATWPVSTPGPPAPPTGLGASSGNSTIDLTWAPSAAADGYNLYRGFASGGPYSNIASGLNSTAHFDTDLANGTTYYYVVTAGNANGESGYSNEASATPSAPAVPDAPSGVTASPGKKKVTVRWDAVAGASSYNVKRSLTSGGPYTTVASGLTGTRYNDTGLSSATTYYYVVSAENSDGESPNSSQAGATAK
jgi:cellulose 1,4-beta-cellobiosidase